MMFQFISYNLIFSIHDYIFILFIFKKKYKNWLINCFHYEEMT